MSNWRNGSSTPRTPQQLELAAAVTPSAAGLPALPDANYPAGALFVQTPSMTIWRTDGATWVQVTTSTADARDAVRRQKLSEGIGYSGQTLPRREASIGVDVSSGRIYYTLYYLFAGEIVNGFAFGSNVAGSGFTLCKQGIANTTNGAVLATTADNSSGSPTWTAVGKKETLLTSQYTHPVEGYVYLAQLWIYTTTAPRMDTGFNTGKGANQARAGFLADCCRSTNVVADLVTPAGFVADGNSVPVWVGVF